MIRLAIFVLAALLTTTAAVAAQDKKQDGPSPEWGKPTADFSADMVFTDDRGRSRTARLYYTAQKQRLEFKAGQEIVAIIFDHQANKAYQLLMNSRGWRPIRAVVPQFFFGMSDPKASREKQGEEKMAGLAVTRFKVSSKTTVGDEFDGTAWATKERIVVKMVGIVVRGRRKQKLTMVMQNLKIGPVDQTLFSVPDTYKKLEPLKK